MMPPYVITLTLSSPALVSVNSSITVPSGRLPNGARVTAPWSGAIGASAATSTGNTHRYDCSRIRTLQRRTRIGADEIPAPSEPQRLAAYFVDPNPSAHENSRNSSFGADAFL